MTFLKSLDSPPFIATYRWAGSFDGRYMPQAYSLLLELNQHTYLPVVNAEFDICVISCGKEWWCFRLVDVKSDERQEGMVARTAYRLNQSMGIAEQMVNMIRAWQSVPYLNPPASDYFR
ncbi:hypothetical protein [Klebsiella pneumoniae]|uniref:hypothetical protein n=1 Tax=Klebsiella pneumoniae TaxID=573 RepID=UPI000F61AF87|nr:hypothetical protein [Klebsiella pneumoniae]RRF11114.1 hypothetical protein EAN93_28020 [Klebsiella pneumoniae]HCI4396862.1 hypothetical protein [Klebsiella pneumoniae]HCI4397207.1 hypothetical protein [Klebsiella pneumoniae]